MNQQQRAFLIKQIEENTKIKIDELKNSIGQEPDLTGKLIHYILSGDYEVLDKEKLELIILNKAQNNTTKSSWISNPNSRWLDEYIRELHLTFKLEEILILPDSFYTEFKEFKERKLKIEEEIQVLKAQLKNLIVRVQLASNSVLAKMISEVDNMGDLTLMDTKLKLLN